MALGMYPGALERDADGTVWSVATLGEVIATGEEVTAFKCGDRVTGDEREFQNLLHHRLCRLALMPSDMTWDEALSPNMLRHGGHRSPRAGAAAAR